MQSTSLDGWSLARLDHTAVDRTIPPHAACNTREPEPKIRTTTQHRPSSHLRIDALQLHEQGRDAKRRECSTGTWMLCARNCTRHSTRAAGSAGAKE